MRAIRTPCLTRLSSCRDVHVLEMGSGHWLEPAPASGSGPAARAFHCAAVVGGAMFIYGGHVYVKEKKGLQKFDDLWRLDTVSCKSLRKSTLPSACCEAQKSCIPDIRGAWPLHGCSCEPSHLDIGSSLNACRTGQQRYWHTVQLSSCP